MAQGYPSAALRVPVVVPADIQAGLTAANDNRIGGFRLPTPANDNRPRGPIGPAIEGPARRSGFSILERIGPFEAFAIGFEIGAIIYGTRGDISLSPGWHVAADCEGPGSFTGADDFSLYCGPLPGPPSPGYILEDPSSWNIVWYNYHLSLEPQPYRVAQLWSATKPYPYNGEPYPDVAHVVTSFQVAPFGVPSPFPWGTGWANAGVPRPLPQPEPFPTEIPTGPRPNPQPKTRPQPRPPLPRPQPHHDYDGGPVVAVLPTPRIPHKPPPRTKERKFAVALPSGALATFISDVTEIDDFVDALEKGLKPRDRAHPVWEPGGTDYNWRRVMVGKRLVWRKERGKYRHPTIQEQAGAIYTHLDKMNWPDAFGSLVKEQIEDIAFGKLGRLTAKANRRRGMPGGIALGPAF